MTHDIHALSGAYAVDAVDDRERALFEEHLALCAACQAEVGSLREAAAVMAGAQAATPSADLRARVLRDISQVRPLPPEHAVASATSSLTAATELPVPDESTANVHSLGAHRARRSAPRRAWLVAAAAAVAVGAAGTAVWSPWDNGQNAVVQAASAQQVRSAADAEHVKLTFAGGAVATVYRSKALNKAVVVTENMPDAPSGKVYQLWLKHADGAFVSAGLMPASGNQSVVFDGDAADAAAAGITVEPAGGSAAPTAAPIALFAFA